MGVPAFYRWLSEKYPKTVQDVLEERLQLASNSGSIRLPFDSTRPNPSGLECDNLYIDMNGIIHPCSHPENGSQPTTEEQMYQNVCDYVDRLFRAIRPRKLLFLAIDGVAPRAKMNQQRSRRFRAAQEARELAELEEHVKEELEKSGQHIPQAKASWDSNVITPGTHFMLKLSEFLRFYIRKRLSTDKAWRDVLVLFSDASIPGEGEHKIMDHVRRQRSQPGYNPNLVHVLHGLDADLIMLALATHEAHFYISREEVVFGRKSKELQEQRQMESGFYDQQRKYDEMVGAEAMMLPENQGKPLQRVSIPILREYLEFEFSDLLNTLPFAPNLERIIDDFVFVCFFVGNDFLPHLPSLDIRDGALDFLLNVYKSLLPGLGDYLTKSGGHVNLSNVDVLVSEVGNIEDYVFRMKYENEQREQERRRQQQPRPRRDGPPPTAITQNQHAVKGRAARILQANEVVALKKKNDVIQVSHKAKDDENMMAAQALKKTLLSGTKRAREEETPQVEEATDLMEVPAEDDIVEEDQEEGVPKIEIVETIDPETAKVFKQKVKEIQGKKLDAYANNVVDNVRLHEAGWKDRYYKDKCKADDFENHGGREHLFRSYVVGLCWVMKYYYEGCPSWKWYYPFHYAPFASDLKNIERFSSDCRNFEQSTPFNPVEQLMAVLPADSSHAIPKASRWLMTDTESPILDFYPRDVPVDPNGKAMPWLWVVLLPFIDEERLLAAFSPTMAKWSHDELLCNARGLDDGYLYVHSSNALSKKLGGVVSNGKTAKDPKTKLTDAAAYGCPGFSGLVRPPLSHELFQEEDAVRPPPTANRVEMNSIFVDPVEANDAVCVAFSEPPRLSHKSILLPGVAHLPPTLIASDKVLRRPRLNRGGGSIANMGVSSGQSYKSGYGSMNIGSYERQLAQQTGRGADMYQTGNRAWGAMEPAPKRRNIPPQVSNPFANQYGGRAPPSSHHQQSQQHWGNTGPNQPRRHDDRQNYGQSQGYPNQNPPPYDNRGQHQGQHPGYQHSHHQGSGQQQGQPQYQQSGGYQRNNQSYNGGPQYQNHQSYNGQGNTGRDGGYASRPSPPPLHIANYGRGPAPPPPPQGHNFRSHNNAGNQQGERRSRASADVMNSLRAQLTSTLNNQRRTQGGQSSRR